jgi:hypothetical protein
MALEGDSGADSILCSPLRARCLRLSETLPTKPLSPSQPLPTGIASLAPPTLRNLYTTTLLCLIVPVRHHLRSLDEPRSSLPASYLSLARSPSLSFLFSRFSHASHQSFLSLVPYLSLSLSLSRFPAHGRIPTASFTSRRYIDTRIERPFSFNVMLLFFFSFSAAISSVNQKTLCESVSAVVDVSGRQMSADLSLDPGRKRGMKREKNVGR